MNIPQIKIFIENIYKDKSPHSSYTPRDSDSSETSEDFVSSDTDKYFDTGEDSDSSHTSEVCESLESGKKDSLSAEKDQIIFRPTGISNHTKDRCFMISSVQCLMACHAIRKIYLSHKYATCRQVTPDYHDPTNSSLRKLFRQQLKLQKPTEQEYKLDISELQCHMFENLIEESLLLEMKEGEHDAGEFFRMLCDRIDPRIASLFSGSRFAISKCPIETCGSQTLSIQPCGELEITLKSENKDEQKTTASFLETLDEYFFDNVSGVSCGKCNGEANRDFISFLSEGKCPSILNIYFKRYPGFMMQDDYPIGAPPLTLFALAMKWSTVVSKLDRSIHIREDMEERMDSLKINQKQKFFSLEPLDYDTEIFKLETYRLRAIILYTGTSESGHYKALVRYGDRWFMCNDSNVTEQNEDISQILNDPDIQKKILNVLYERD